MGGLETPVKRTVIDHSLDNSFLNFIKFVTVNELLQKLVSVAHEIHIITEALRWTPEFGQPTEVS